MSEQKDTDTWAPGCPVLFSAQPVPMSFLHRYLLCFVPVVLVLATIAVTMALTFLVETGSVLVSSSTRSITVSHLAAVDSTGITRTMTAGLSDAPAICILMIAPVGIFIIVAAIGWTLRITELWTGPALTLGLSALGAVASTIVFGMHTPSMFLYYLKWIAFLVQPLSILATGIVLLWLNRFRVSIHYTITDAGICIRGGVGILQEHQLPFAWIGSVVFEQGFLGARYGYGTVIPVIAPRWRAEPLVRGSGAGGLTDNLSGWGVSVREPEEPLRSPLDCLYGIPHPNVVQQIIVDRISRYPIRGEE